MSFNKIINLYYLLPVICQQWTSFDRSPTSQFSIGPPYDQSSSSFASPWDQRPPLYPQQQSACPRITIRKEFTEASPQEREVFFKTLRTWAQMNDNGSLREFSKIHEVNKDQTHFRPCFLPWHRKFLRLSELALQKINPSFIMLYWDWTKDYKYPHRSIVWNQAYLGGNGDSYYKYVRDGAYYDIDLLYPQPHRLKRDWDRGNELSQFSSPLEIKMVIEGSSSYQQIYDMLKNDPHAKPHDNVGGNVGDMQTHHSPNDPLFWLHHTFIDLIWWTWQQNNGARGLEYYGEGGASQTDNLPYYYTPVAEVLDTKKFPNCYSYDKKFDYKLPYVNPYGIQTYYSSAARRAKKVTTSASFSFSKKSSKFAFISTNAKNIQKVADDIESGDLPSFSIAYDDLEAPEELMRDPKPLSKKFLELNKYNETELKEYQSLVSSRNQAVNAQLAMDNATIWEYFSNKWDLLEEEGVGEVGGKFEYSNNLVSTRFDYFTKVVTITDNEKLTKPTGTTVKGGNSKKSTTKTEKSSKPTSTSKQAKKSGKN